MIAFGVCVGDEEVFQRHAFPTITALGEPNSLILTSRDNTSIFEAYNEMLDHLAGLPDLEGVLLLHEDVELKDPQLMAKVRAALNTQGVGIAGVVGATDVTSLAWWEGNGRGRCQETRGLVDFGGGTYDVDAVDGLFMALSPWAVRTVRFDAARYTGFHGYDVDYCFSARQAGARVIVTDIDLFHHTKGGFGNVENYERSNAVFIEKWPHEPDDNHKPNGTPQVPEQNEPKEPTMAMTTVPPAQETSPGPGRPKSGSPKFGDRKSGNPKSGNPKSRNPKPGSPKPGSPKPGSPKPDGKVRIDLGGGKIPKAGWMNLDPGHGEGPWRRFAQEVPWPIEDGTVEEIHASHMMEHVPAGADRIAVMNEAWRVLRPGGTFEIRVPMFPGWQAIADPTHVSYWVPQSFYYFTGDIGPDADYGIKYWTADYVTVIDGWELRALMRKPEAA